MLRKGVVPISSKYGDIYTIDMEFEAENLAVEIEENDDELTDKEYL